jgi:hypothetical protein
MSDETHAPAALFQCKEPPVPTKRMLGGPQTLSGRQWRRINSSFQTFAVFWMLYAFFWVIPRRLNFICRRFGSLYMFILHKQAGVEFYIYLPMKIKQNVPKRRNINFRRREITQKKAYRSNFSWIWRYSKNLIFKPKTLSVAPVSFNSEFNLMSLKVLHWLSREEAVSNSKLGEEAYTLWTSRWLVDRAS